jgi:hypothetical protein
VRHSDNTLNVAKKEHGALGLKPHLQLHGGSVLHLGDFEQVVHQARGMRGYGRVLRDGLNYRSNNNRGGAMQSAAYLKHGHCQMQRHVRILRGSEVQHNFLQ